MTQLPPITEHHSQALASSNDVEWQWLVRGLLTVMLPVVFLGAGLAKAVGTPMHTDNFVGWGYPLYLMHAVGAAEMVLAGLMLVRRTRFIGAVGLACVMAGAVATHIVAVDYAMLTGPALMLVLVSFVGWTARPWRDR